MLLHCSPYWTGRLAQVVEKTLRHQEVHLIWYVEDILILGDSQKSVSTNLEILLHTCNEARLIVNKNKSQLIPSQQVNYLGQQIDLRTRIVGPQPAKLSRGLEMTKAYLRRRKSSPAHIAGVAGTLLDLQKGNVALHGLAKCIMREAAWMLQGGVGWRTYTPY
ncbi:MAG: reverse transcriptase domain-containing protein, partial [Ferrimicrobium sp.]